MKTRLKIKNLEYWLCFFGILAYYCLGVSATLHENNTTYALEQINRYNSNIFANNFAVYTEGMSARFFMNFIVGLGMKLSHGNWADIGIPLIYLGIFILTLATVEIVFNITDRYHMNLAIILAFFIRHNVNTGFPGWGSFEMNSLGLGTAYAFTMLAFSQVVGDKHWSVAWIILAIATLCHVHEGLWGFCLLFIFYLEEAYEKKRLKPEKKHWTFIIFVGVMVICVVPGIFGVKSGLTSEEFVQIYAYFRTPHHLVPTAWGLSVILKNFAVVVLSALILLITKYLNNSKEVNVFIIESGIAIVSWIGALIVVYIFTEKVPIATIVTMYIPKYFKYIGILSQIWCLRAGIEWIKKKEYLIAGTIIFVIYAGSNFSLSDLIPLYGILILGLFLLKKYGIEEMQYLMPIAALAIITENNSRILTQCIRLMFIIYSIVFLEKGLFKRLLNNIIVVIICAILMLGYATKDRIWTINNGHISGVEFSSYIVGAMGSDLYNLAREFKDTTSTNEMFLADPNDGINCWFQLASERNSYTNTKNVPAAQVQIKEWYERIMETKELLSKSPLEIYSIMNRESINYILVKSDFYEQFDNSDLFVIRNASSNDQFRIYEIR